MTKTNGKGVLPVNERTRFLPRLDAMSKQDAQGLAQDMLQKLREMGYIQTVEASGYLTKMDMRRSPSEYRKHTAHGLAQQIGMFLGEQGHLRFAEEEVKVVANIVDAQPGDSKLSAQVDIVVVK